MGLLKDAYPDARVILVDLGNFTAGFHETGLLKTRAYIDALVDLDYDVAGIGERELAGGLDRFDEILGEVPITLTTASFAEQGGAATLAPPYVVREYEVAGERKIKIGFVSISAPGRRLVGPGPEGRAIVSLDPVAQARQYIPLAAGEADLVVLMANLSPFDLRRVAEAVPGAIDVVLASSGGRTSPGGLEPIGGVSALYAGDQGRRVGEVRIRLEGREVAEMTGSLVLLTDRYPEEPGLRRIVDRMTKQMNALRRVKP